MPPSKALRILFIEDTPEDFELEERELRKGGLDFVATCITRREELEAAFRDFKPDIVLSDYSLPHLQGLDILEIVRGISPETPFIFVSGTIGEERAIESLKKGATDYVVKDRLGGLVVRVRRAIAESEERATRRRLEEELRHAQRMEALGRLAGGVAHDMNNFLTAILGYGELLLAKVGPRDPGRDEIEQMYRAAESAVSLTRHLLAFSRKTPLTLKPVELNSLVTATLKLLKRVLGGDVKLESDLDPSAGLIRADVGGLEQILLNLAVNARDAMPGGGTLTLRTRRRRLSAPELPPGVEMAPGEFVLLEVSDTGCGISPAIMLHIFEPFFTTKPAGKGTGLGLSTVYGLVKTFNGGIAVESEVGKGTTLRLFFPALAAPTDTTRRDAMTAAAPTGQETVLVAEDEDAIRKLIRHVLSAQGYTVLEAADGDQALKLAEAGGGRIDLVLTDSVMPRMSGRELALRFRQLRPEVPILLMSGYSEKASEESPLPEGVGFLGKPFTPLALAGKIREILDARRGK